MKEIAGILSGVALIVGFSIGAVSLINAAHAANERARVTENDQLINVSCVLAVLQAGPTLKNAKLTGARQVINVTLVGSEAADFGHTIGAKPGTKLFQELACENLQELLERTWEQ